MNRRQLLAAASAAGLAASTLPRRGLAQAQEADPREGDTHRGRCAIGSGNAVAASERALELLGAGTDPVDGVVAGVTLVEDDPDDMSVGLGGLPNWDGVVQLDASVMHGPSHRAGAVGALEDVQNPAQVALLVLKKTDHVMLVGHGAKRFAIEHGFEERNLLTDKAREAWLRWRARQNPADDHLDPDQQLGTEGELEIPYTTGTVHLSAVTDDGDLGAVTSTSGLSYKIPGRVGDSPIVGAGMFCDNAVGSAGATGRGEAVIQSCGAFSVVREMEHGLTPTEACLAVLRRIASRTRRPYLLNEAGEPNFQVVLYALRKDGAYGSASMRAGGMFAVHDGESARRLPSVPLFQ